MILFLDKETFSATPISAGTYRYAADSEIMLLAYAINDEPAQVWDITADSRMPGGLEMALEDDEVEIVAHNVGFDRTVYQLSKTSRDWPAVRLERWRCTMARSLAHSLPGSLGKLGEVFGLAEDHQKHKDGKKLIHLFCKPRPSNAKIDRATSFTHPEEWERFVEYARIDVEGMRDIHRRLPYWNYRGGELASWHLDQRINQRGFRVDIGLAKSAIRAVDAEQSRLAASTFALTDGEVEAATQRDKLLAHILAEYGVKLPDMTASTIERRAEDETLPDSLRELLRVRLASTTSSTSKYAKLMGAVSDDDRLRGTLQWCGASRTGRWAGRTFQPHNLMRPTLKGPIIAAGIKAIKAGVADLTTDNVMELCANAMRGVIVAAPGRKLCVSDLSNIEGRALAWLAGETWKLDAFRAFDEGEGADLYCVAYGKSFGVDPRTIPVKGDDRRQIGKVQELALGYQGGVGAFVTMAATYRMDLVAMSKAAWPVVPAEVKAEIDAFIGWIYDVKAGDPMRLMKANMRAMQTALGDPVFRACDALKRMWRAAHPATVAFWKEIEETVIAAINANDEVFLCQRLKVVRSGAWLRIVLPSGRSLCYPSPRVEGGKISYMGVNQYSRKWARLSTYGGKLVENVTQAFARDVLATAMQPCEDAGYPIVLTVHDELLTEPLDDPEWSVAGLSHLLSTPPAWASDIPLAAAGFEDYRYRKD